MSSEKKAYDHTSETPGQGAEPDDATEHRDTADGDDARRNELRPDERREQDGRGPRTHQDTRVTRKDGA